MLRFFDHFVRQRAIERFAHVGTESGHHRADGIRSQRRYARKSRSRDSPARALQQAAAAQVPIIVLLPDLRRSGHVAYSISSLFPFAISDKTDAVRHRC